MMSLSLTKPGKSVSKELCADQCGSACCKNRLCYVSEGEAARLQALNPKVLVAKNDQGQWAMFLKPDGCLFLHESGTCSIYEVRPQACRAFPMKPSKNCLIWPE